MKIYLIRHGQSEANRIRMIQGQYDAPLTDLGHSQAKKIHSLLPSFDKIYASPLSRVRQTAINALGEMKVPEINYREDLMEIGFGELEGKMPDEIENFNMDKFIEFIRFARDTYEGEFGVELINDFFERSSKAFDEIVQEAQQEKNQRVAIFAHGGIMRSIVQFHLGLLPEEESHFKNCEIVVLSQESSDNEWEIERHRDHISI